MSRDFFLGVGGTASSNIFGRYLFNRPNWGAEPTSESTKQAIILMSGVDSGGSIGLQNDLLSLNDGDLNQLLHEDRHFPFQSYGDLKHFLISSLRFKNPETPWKEYWDFRSDSSKLQQENFTNLANQAGLPQSLEKSFREYLEVYLDYAKQNRDQISIERHKPACSGNLLLAFLHKQAGELNQLSKLLIELGLIPDWVDFIFLSSKRTHLQGRDKQDSLVDGEHLFDEWPEPILPHTHKIRNDDLSICLLNPKLLELLDSLTSEDRLILPPGSDSNWLGILNNAEIRSKIQLHPIHWLANLFRFSSETTLSETLKHVNDLGLYPEVFLPNYDFIEALFAPENVNSLKSYVLDEQKIPQVIYLPTYREQIVSHIEKMLADRGLRSAEASLAEKLLAEAEFLDKPSLSFKQQAKLHYTVSVTHLDTRYAHDREYAEKWLS